MSDSKETLTNSKIHTQSIDINLIEKRLEELEKRFTQLETIIQTTFTLDALAAWITGKKTIKKRRASDEWSVEEKKLSTKKWWLPRRRKKMKDGRLPRLKLRRNKP